MVVEIFKDYEYCQNCAGYGDDFDDIHCCCKNCVGSYGYDTGLVHLAFLQAHKNHDYKFRHGCVIFSGNNVISRGYNRRQFHPLLRKYGYKWAWLHAESDAIIRALKARKHLEGATSLGVRAGKTKLCNSKPCANCIAMMEAVGIREVLYSAEDGSIERVLLRE